MRSFYNQIIDQDNEQVVKTSAGLTSVAAGIPTILLGKKVHPGLRLGMFLGLSTTLGIAHDKLRGWDTGEAVLSNTLAGAAGYVAYLQKEKVANVGVATLESFLSKQPGRWEKTLELFERAKNIHPVFSSFLSRETIGMGLAIASVPIAHSIIQRLLIDWHREKGRGYSPTMGSEFRNQAGREAPRENREFMRDGHSSADVNVRGKIGSAYSSQALRDEYN